MFLVAVSHLLFGTKSQSGPRKTPQLDAAAKAVFSGTLGQRSEQITNVDDVEALGVV